MKEENIPGFKSMLIDHLDIQRPALNFIVDQVLKTRLFTFITETSMEANTILKMNQEMRGGPITIFPLELIDQMATHDDEFRIQDKQVQMLISSVKLKQGSDPWIEKLIKHYLENVVLVKDLEKAFEVSGKHKNLTCITSKF